MDRSSNEYRLVEGHQPQGNIVRYYVAGGDDTERDECTGETTYYSDFSDTQRSVMRDAMNKWQEVCGVRFVEVEDDDEADLAIALTRIDGYGGFLGGVLTGKDLQEIADRVNSLCGEDITLDGDEAILVVDRSDYPPYWMSTLDRMEFHNVLLHEIGHALGIAHSDVGGQVMSGDDPGNTEYLPVRQYWFQLQPDDIAAAQALYGPPGGARELLSPEFLENITLDVNEGSTPAWPEGNPFANLPSHWVQSTVGTESGEILTGGYSKHNLILGRGGNDIVTGQSHDDALHGGAGNDKLWGQSGDDLVAGGAGNDVLYGMRGSDTLLGGTGSDILLGGDEGGWQGGTGDQLEGGSGDDRMWGESGEDTLWGGRGSDFVSGGAMDDRLYGGTGNDYLDGGSGDDLLVGGDAKDMMAGGEGDDTLHGGLEGDTFFGQGGDDTFVVRGGTNWIMDFQPGKDTIYVGEAELVRIEQSGHHGLMEFDNGMEVWLAYTDLGAYAGEALI